MHCKFELFPACLWELCLGLNYQGCPCVKVSVNKSNMCQDKHGAATVSWSYCTRPSCGSFPEPTAAVASWP